MALPLIPIILGSGAVATFLFGGKKGYDAYQDSKIANDCHERAKKEFEESSSKLNFSRKTAEDKFKNLGELQKEIIECGFKRYMEIIDKLNIQNNVSLESVLDKETINGLRAIKESIVSLEVALGGFVGGAIAGAMAGFGAFGGAGLLASASTGTAISALSGVAATNATLAWFGGGSLAAGGLGMAGGTAILGGIVAAPVIAVAASVWATSAEKKKYDASAYYASVKTLCEAMETESLNWKQIIKRAQEKLEELQKYNRYFIDALDKVTIIMNYEGMEVSKWKENGKEELKFLMQVTEAVVKIIGYPLMSDEDILTQELRKHQENCSKLMEEIQDKWGK